VAQVDITDHVSVGAVDQAQGNTREHFSRTDWKLAAGLGTVNE
jgi:hypothetical protein